MKLNLYLSFFLIFIISCGYIHDPFRTEFHEESETTPPQTPIVQRIRCCELTDIASVTFTNIPSNGESLIKIYYACSEPTTIIVTHSTDDIDESISKEIKVPASEEIAVITDPLGMSAKSQLKISLAEEDKDKKIYIRKIMWPKTDEIAAREYLVEDLPAKCFSNGASLVYFN